jgi:hypothetical protein
MAITPNEFGRAAAALAIARAGNQLLSRGELTEIDTAARDIWDCSKDHF